MSTNQLQGGTSLKVRYPPDSIITSWATKFAFQGLRSNPFLNSLIEMLNSWEGLQCQGLNMDNASIIPGNTHLQIERSPTTKQSTRIEIKVAIRENPKHKPVVIVRNRSWPAVSQICNLTRLPSSSMVLILKSILSRNVNIKSQENYNRYKRGFWNISASNNH